MQGENDCAAKKICECVNKLTAIRTDMICQDALCDTNARSLIARHGRREASAHQVLARFWLTALGSLGQVTRLLGQVTRLLGQTP